MNKNIQSSVAVNSAVGSTTSSPENKVRGRKSKLLPYVDDIRRMRGENVTYRAIAEYIASRGVKVNPVSIQIFAGKLGMTKKRDSN